MFERSSRSVHPLPKLIAVVLVVVGLSGCGQKANPAGERITTAPPVQPAIEAPQFETPDDAVADRAEQFARQVTASFKQTSASPIQSSPPPDVIWSTPPNRNVSRASESEAVADSEPVFESPDSPVTAQAEPGVGGGDPGDTAAAPMPPAALTGQSTPELVKILADRLKADARAGQQGLRPWLARAAMSLVDPSRELTESDLSSLPVEDRRLVLAYQRAFTHLARSVDAESDQARQQLRIAAEELAEQVAGEKRFAIRQVQLCTQVGGYGQYETFATNNFLAGIEHPVIVYAELENFTPSIDAQGQYTVNLNDEIVLYNARDGLAVWRVRPTSIFDRSRNLRRDFFIRHMIELPALLTPAKYLLKVTITDQIGQTMDEATIPIQIVADPKLIVPQ